MGQPLGHWAPVLNTTRTHAPSRRRCHRCTRSWPTAPFQWAPSLREEVGIGRAGPAKGRARQGPRPPRAAPWGRSRLPRSLPSPPPTPRPGTVDEFVTLQSPGGTPGGGLSVGGGFRVPCIVVSPWTVGGYVCSEPFDHTSVLQFVEKVTGITETNILRMDSFVPGHQR